MVVAQMPVQRNWPGSSSEGTSHRYPHSFELVNVLVGLAAVVVHGPGVESIKRTVPESLCSEM